MFLLKKTEPEDFFLNGKPRDEFVFNAILPMGEKYRIAYTNLNNTGVINQRFRKKEVVRSQWTKLLNPAYGSGLIKTLLLMPWDAFVGFRNPHIAASHKKETFFRMWELEGEALDATCANRFRGLNDLSHWLMRYWNLCTGEFVPRKSSFGKYFNVSDRHDGIVDYIRGQKGHLICINDMSTDFDFEKAKKDIADALAAILPEKSAFEI